MEFTCKRHRYLLEMEWLRSSFKIGNISETSKDDGPIPDQQDLRDRRMKYLQSRQRKIGPLEQKWTEKPDGNAKISRKPKDKDEQIVRDWQS